MKGNDKKMPARNWRFSKIDVGLIVMHNLMLNWVKRERTVGLWLENKEPALSSGCSFRMAAALTGAGPTPFEQHTLPFQVFKTGLRFVLFYACMWSLVHSTRLIHLFIYSAKMGSLLKCVWCPSFFHSWITAKHTNKQAKLKTVLYTQNDTTLKITVAH